jgi:hypothetical protein
MDERQGKVAVEESLYWQELIRFWSELPIPDTYIPVFSHFLSHSPPWRWLPEIGCHFRELNRIADDASQLLMFLSF